MLLNTIYVDQMLSIDFLVFVDWTYLVNKRSDASDSSEPVGFYGAPYFNTETH